MTKKNFVTLLLSVMGGIPFSLGMCMALIPEWNLFHTGIIVGSAGLAILLVMVLVRRKMSGLSLLPRLNGKTIATILVTLVGLAGLGIGMSLCLAMEGMMLWGIIIGTAGILVLLCLIPLVKGLK